MAETRRLLLEYETEEVGRLAREKPKVRTALIKAFSDASEIVRQRALFAALDMGDPSIVIDVEKALSDDEAEVRVVAAEVLAWYQQPRTIPQLLKGLKDTDTWVKSHCASGLSKLINGPIWARVKQEDVDIFIENFQDMDDTAIEEFLTELKVRPDAIDKFLGWRRAEFDIEIDVSLLAAELEASPIILDESFTDTSAESMPGGLSPEVESILTELPTDLRGALPTEDLQRLTAATARELVDSLLGGLPSEPPPKPKKKKTVKVKRVKKVKRKRKGPSREELIGQIPDEVKDSLPEGTLDDLAIEDLEALISTSSALDMPVEEPSKKKKTVKVKKRRAKMTSKRKQLIESIPPLIRESISDTDLESMSSEDIIKLIETDAPDDKSEESRLESLTNKFGAEKAELLASMPPEMLEGIPDDQIEEMDMDTLKGLAEALGPID
ncbi:MAG: HEAT repeat domain-containing protein [Candidatus Thorarchaeota archaeon]